MGIRKKETLDVIPVDLEIIIFIIILLRNGKRYHERKEAVIGFVGCYIK